MSTFIDKLVRRYNTIYPEKDNILPVTLAKDMDKCKDFDINKVDLRYNKIPISNKQTNNTNYIKNADCTV
jgi:hypothetical protein